MTMQIGRNCQAFKDLEAIIGQLEKWDNAHGETVHNSTLQLIADAKDSLFRAEDYLEQAAR